MRSDSSKFFCLAYRSPSCILRFCRPVTRAVNLSGEIGFVVCFTNYDDITMGVQLILAAFMGKPAYIGPPSMGEYVPISVFNCYFLQPVSYWYPPTSPKPLDRAKYVWPQSNFASSLWGVMIFANFTFCFAAGIPHFTPLGYRRKCESQSDFGPQV